MAEEQTQKQPAGLSIEDLNSMKSIIDVASQRGAFKANEMAQVGQTYNKLEAFLNDIARQQEEQQKAQSAEGQTPATEQVAQGE